MMSLMCYSIYRVQNQVSGVINTMKDNIGKVLERGDKLEDLEEKSGTMKNLNIYYYLYNRRVG